MAPEEMKFSAIGDPDDFSPQSMLPDGVKVGDVVTIAGYYEPHPDPRHVYTPQDILILWSAGPTGLTRIQPPRKIPRTRKRLLEERAWWDEWQAKTAQRLLSAR